MNTAKLQVGFDAAVEVQIVPGLTIQEALKRNQQALGVDPGTGYTFKVGNQTVQGSALLLAGSHVVATPTRETKAR